MSNSLIFVDKTPASCAVSTDSTTILPLSFPEAITKRPVTHAQIDRTEPQRFENLIDGHGQPFYVPDYTVNDIRKAIPKECFERSALRGLGYVARDITLIIGTFYLFNKYLDVNSIESSYVRWSLWSLYGFLNGLFGTGIWVLAHECGHQAFSTSKVLNDTVGFALHSSLLVPYFSWKISHGKHHKATAHMERDMVFVPRTRQEHCDRFGVVTEHLHEIVQDTPLYAAYYIFTRLLFGWPTYLLTNNTGHDFHERQAEGRGRGKRNGLFTGVNHFNPSSPLFENRDAKWIFVSDLGILGVATLLYFIGLNYGWPNLFKWYFVPYLWVNSWLGKRWTEVSLPPL
jgi:omega-6 fatty acid desaturase (delta-12 desaturase)